MATRGDEALDEDIDILTEKDLYKILGVSRGAKPDEIKKAYRKRSLKYHPDKNPDDPDAKPKFQKIAEAFSILSDSKKRLKYDKSGDMDLEDFDMDQFLNMWVGEMMEDGGMVDEMMQSVLPWRNDDEKMIQFMEEKTKQKGKKLVCQICQHTASTKGLMRPHFEQKHQYDCEDWANNTVKDMKASFESFMKQVTGIGDDTGTFILPDGTTADMSNVKGVPNIREHMQKKVDKAKEEDAVKEMYRKLDAEGSTYVPSAEEISKLLRVDLAQAEELRTNKDALLRKLKKAIDRLNEEEDDEAAMMEAMGGLDGLDGLGGFGGGFGAPGGFGGFAGFGGKGGGKNDIAGLLGALGGGSGLEAMLAGGLDDPEMLEALLSQGGLGGLGGMGMPMPGGLGGMGMPMPGGFGGMCMPCPGGGLGGKGAGGRRTREPPKEEGPRQDIGCKCGYSCGTMKALEKHLAKFLGDPAHEARVSERPPSPPRVSRDIHGDLPPGLAEQLGLGAGGAGPSGFLGSGGGASPYDDLPPGVAEKLGLRPSFGNMNLDPDAAPSGRSSGRASVSVDTDSGGMGCICGYSCGTLKALQRHLDRFPSDPNHKRK